MSIRVLIVDDSRLFRCDIQESLEKIPGIQVVGSVWNGEKALEFLQNNDVDLMTLDVEMPTMNGLETVRKIREYQGSGRIRCQPGIVMICSSSDRGCETTISALDSGAYDFILKPDATQKDPQHYLLRELKEKVVEWKAIKAGTVSAQRRSTNPLPVVKRDTVKCSVSNQLIAIGVSTGGPKALADMLPLLSKSVSCPILIVQHMPEHFTLSLAQSLDKICEHTVVEASENLKIQGRMIYIAPGGKHLVVNRKSDGLYTGINEHPPESGCRPSVDVLFRSLAISCGANTIAVILTGMGSDGTAGVQYLKRVGAPVLVQDEATSVVWGMPRSAYETGLVDKVIPLMEIPSEIISLIEGTV